MTYDELIRAFYKKVIEVGKHYDFTPAIRFLIEYRFNYFDYWESTEEFRFFGYRRIKDGAPTKAYEEFFDYYSAMMPELGLFFPNKKWFKMAVGTLETPKALDIYIEALITIYSESGCITKTDD